MFETEIIISEDELTGYIMRKTEEHQLTHKQVRAVLDAELEYLKSKGVIYQE